MKTIAAMLTLGVACWAFGTQAQTFDTRLLSQYDASVLRELYPVCRHTTVSAEQQVRLAERIRQENLRFAELICSNTIVTKRFRQPTPAGAKPRRSFRSSSNSPIWS